MKGLRTTIYKVQDIEAAKAWYTKAFGVEPYFDNPVYVGFNIGGYELGLWSENADTITIGNNVLTYWATEDIQNTFNHLLSIGGSVCEAPNNVGGEIMVATVYDPWRNIVGLIYNPEFKAE